MKKIVKIVFLVIILNLIFLSNAFADNDSFDVSSNSAFLMDYQTGKILYEKNMNEKIYPASITKIMTAIIVIENCDLNDTVTISESAVKNVEFGYVTGNLVAGETFTVDQLLHILLIPSANDAAFALSEYVSRFY